MVDVTFIQPLNKGHTKYTRSSIFGHTKWHTRCGRTCSSESLWADRGHWTRRTG